MIVPRHKNLATPSQALIIRLPMPSIVLDGPTASDGESTSSAKKINQDHPWVVYKLKNTNRTAVTSEVKAETVVELRW
jgi:hypothetical protein